MSDFKKNVTLVFIGILLIILVVWNKQRKNTKSVAPIETAVATSPGPSPPKPPPLAKMVAPENLNAEECSKFLDGKDQIVVTRKELDDVYNKIATLKAQIESLRERQEWRYQSFTDRVSNNKKLMAEKANLAQLRDSLKKLELKGERKKINQLSALVKQCLGKN